MNVISNEHLELYIGDYSLLSENITNNTIQMIYIDPPFNSARDYKLNKDSSIGFTDKWTDELYMEFITTLIDRMYNLLRSDGTLFFHISSNEMYIPEVILRKKFKYVTPIFWKKCRSKNNVKNKLGSTIDIIFKCNKIKKCKFNLTYQKRDKQYEENSFENKDERGNFALGHIVTEKTKEGYIYSFQIGSTEYNPSNGWRITKEALQELYDDNRIYIPKQVNSNLYKKIYKHEHPGKPCTDLWDDIHSIGQGKEKRLYPTEKPIKLLERLVLISTDEGDTILDPMCGSGTTGKACSNLNRKCILNDINQDTIQIIQNRLI